MGIIEEEGKLVFCNFFFVCFGLGGVGLVFVGFVKGYLWELWIFLILEFREFIFFF